jgi:hypothetical protein
MTERKSRSKTPGAQNRPSGRRSAAAPQRPEPIDRLPGREPPPTTLEEAIEQERGRMDKACSVLGCLRHSLTYQEHFEGDADRPSFADVAELARDLVADAVHRLDSLYIAHLPRERPARKERDRSRRRGHQPTK